MSTPHVEPRAVSVVIHGLNLKPEKMDEIATFLTARGSEVLRVSLTGHHGDIEARKDITRQLWTQEVFQAYTEARAHADRLQVPLYFVGYSLGAVLNLDVLLHQSARYDKMIFFAPAIENKAPEGIMRFLRHLLGKSGSLFSLNLKEYRAHDSTSFTMYVALLDSENAVHEKGLQTLAGIPTLIFLDPDDETVSFDRTAKLLHDSQLEPAWKLIPVNNNGSTLRKKYHHLIIDRESVGVAQWRTLERAMDEHLDLLK
jgi:alpha-beta hydrolase superfamily lysophospholipase